MIDKTEQEIMQHWKGNISRPVVSVCSITYNHESFIEEALDSFLMQETKFPFEIVVDDDCSTDNTAKIIEKYIEKYPHIMNANLRKKNVGITKNFMENMLRVRGEYIALCEGDDYWVDILKLQKQYDILKLNINCSMVCHNVEIVKENRSFLRLHSKGRINNEWLSGIYDANKVVGAYLTVPHTSSIFFKKEFLNYEFFKEVLPFDYPLIVSLCKEGNVYYINAVMSAYRQNMMSISYVRNHLDGSLLKEIKTNHYRMLKYLNKMFEKEIKNNLNGHYMMYYEYNLKYFFKNFNIVEIIRYTILMIRHSKNSQYTLRDILWIVRQEVIQKFKRLI